MESKYALCVLHIFIYPAKVINHMTAMKKASNANTL